MRKNMWSIYRKWMIIAVLCTGMYFVTASDGFVTDVAAAPCMEECEDNWASCKDECQEACSDDGSPSACTSCIGACSLSHLQCMGSAVFCEIELTYSPRCTTQFGQVFDTVSSTYKGGYWQTCVVLSHPEMQCLNCPSTHVCPNPNSLPIC